MMQTRPNAEHAAEAAQSESNAKPNQDTPVDGQPDAIQTPAQPDPNMMNMDAGGFSGMNWNCNGNSNGMNPFMANAMFSFPNQMGMFF